MTLTKPSHEEIETHKRNRQFLHTEDAESELLSAAEAAEKRAAATDPDGHAAASAALAKAQAVVDRENQKLEARRREIASLENQIAEHGRLRARVARFNESFPPTALDALGNAVMDTYEQFTKSPSPAAESQYTCALQTLVERCALNAFITPRREKLAAEVEASKSAIQARAKALKVNIGNLLRVMQADCFAKDRDAVGQFRIIKPEVHSIVANGLCDDLK